MTLRAELTGITSRDWGALLTTLKFYPVLVFDTPSGRVEFSESDLQTVKDAMYTAMVAEDTALNASLPSDAQSNLSAQQKRDAYVHSIVRYRIKPV